MSASVIKTKRANYIQILVEAGKPWNPALALSYMINGGFFVSDVSTFVEGVQNVCSKNKALIGNLDIVAHGEPRGVLIGKDPVTLNTFARYSQTLQKLTPFFDPKVSFVTFQTCQLGQNQPLIKRFSTVWGGVAVRGYEKYQKAWRSEGIGPKITCKLNMCNPS